MLITNAQQISQAAVGEQDERCTAAFQERICGDGGPQPNTMNL